MRLLMLLVLCAGVAAPVPAGRPAGPGRAAIASAHPLATEAGFEVLRAGGNAFDAAVALASALAVVEPTGSGLGGGGFFLLHRARDGREVFIDARERAPAAATHDMFLDGAGNPDHERALRSALSAGIPGEVAGLGELARRYGRLPLGRSLQPAIRLAREGFPLYPHLQQAIGFTRERLAAQPDIARNFLAADGSVPALGAIIRQPELAATLTEIAARGPESFYRGALARRLVAGVHAQGGNWTAEDLADYRVVERAPIVGHYRGARIVSAPPPSSGGIALTEALNILANFDIGAPDTALRDHLIIEASRRALRDRAVYLGDPDYVRVPIARLTSPEYAAGLAASIRTDRATPSAALPGIGAGAAQGPQTTHFSVIDAQGNRVAATLSINFAFGSGRMIAGTGIFMNNEMDDFSMKPGVPNGFQLVGGEANAIAPGKRPLSSMTPTFVEYGSRVMVVGTPGGSQITGMVLLATLAFIDGRDAAGIAAEPRLHHQYLPDVVRYEPDALDADERAGLVQRGHALRESSRRYGNLQVVIWDRSDNRLEAAADPRVDGLGKVE
ncbi:MAG: gamma-glutamyltransferase [Gammaproteobacteria bacterium]|nr:gamma-glutamyltransferase [Gammaproteobacteria bacterium]